VPVTYDRTEDTRQDPFVTDVDVAGLYRPDAAAAASKATTTRIGTENMTDD
jgi:hypothetical protein